MTNRIKSADRDIRGSLAAIKRAARQAREIAAATGTPVYVLKKGKVVNLNPGTKGRASQRRSG